MKLLLNVLAPTIYEFIEPEDLDSVVFITYPDLTPGSEGLHNFYSSSDLWRDSRCMGIDFKEKLGSQGYDIEEYDRDCSYTLSMEAVKALLSDIKNYPEASMILDQQPDTTDLTGKVTVYEFNHRETGNALLLVNPKYDKLDMKVLPCLSKEIIEIEVESQAAVDYFTKESLYIYKEEQFKEVQSGFPGTQKIKDLTFNEGHCILRWEGVLKEDTHDSPRPWRIKLEALRDEVEKILDSNTCIYMKERRIRKLINKYYGNL